MIDFANKHLWPLLLLALLPVAVHLLVRRRDREVVLPTARFLPDDRDPTLRRSRFLEVALVATRSLLLAALATAALGPHLRGNTGSDVSDDKPRALCIVIDASFSMLQRDNAGATSLQRAVALAERILDGTRTGDAVTFLVAPRLPGDTTPTQRARAPHLGTLRASLANLRARPGRFRLADAINTIRNELQRAPVEGRIGYVLSDLAANVLTEDGSAAPSGTALETPHERHPVHVLDVGSVGRSNQAIVHAAVPTSLVGTDRPLAVHAVARSYGTTNNGPVRLLRGNVEAAASTLDSQGRASFEIKLDAGWHALTIELPTRDHLLEDDRRYLSARVSKEAPILITGPRGAGRRHLRWALTNPTTTRAASILTVSEKDTIAESLARYRVLVCTDGTPLTAENSRTVAEFVHRGGGALLFFGRHTDRVAWNRFASGSTGYLPVRLGRLDVFPEPGARVELTDLEHPGLRLFAGHTHTEFHELRVTAWRRPADATHPVEHKELARLVARGPWIVERRYGRGRVIAILSDASLEASELPRSSLFLPLVRELVRYLAGSSERFDRSLECGDVVRVPLNRRQQIEAARVTTPFGTTEPLQLSEQPQLATFDRTLQPGVYELQLPGAEPETFAVNFPSHESDLTQLSEEERRDLSERRSVTISKDGVIEARSEHGSRPRRLWRWCVAVALALCLLELLIQNRLARG